MLAGGRRLPALQQRRTFISKVITRLERRIRRVVTGIPLTRSILLITTRRASPTRWVVGILCSSGSAWRKISVRNGESDNLLKDSGSLLPITTFPPAAERLQYQPAPALAVTSATNSI